MFTLKIFIAAVVASTCNALALGNAQVLKTRDVKCSYGEPFDVTTVVLDNGAEVQGWGCKLSPTELAAHEQSEDDFKLGTYDTRGISVRETSLTKRQFNACGINCTTYCYGGNQGGPDPNHCSQLAQGWTSGTFLVAQGNTYFYSLGSCQVQITNRLSSGGLTYCWNDLRGVTNYIAWNCQATQNAHGGYCVMNNAWNIGSISVNACCA